MEPVKATSLPQRMPKAGAYLFSEGERHLYVGRSNRLRQRLQEHCRASATHKMGRCSISSISTAGRYLLLYCFESRATDMLAAGGVAGSVGDQGAPGREDAC